jgi:hypothetical protein
LNNSSKCAVFCVFFFAKQTICSHTSITHDKAASENTSDLSARPPHRRDHMEKLIKSVGSARATCDGKFEVWAFCDNGRPDLQDSFSKAVLGSHTPENIEQTALTLVHSEEDLKKRGGSNPTAGQVENISFVSARDENVFGPTRKNKHFSGSTAGSAITDVDVPKEPWLIAESLRQEVFAECRFGPKQANSNMQDTAPVNFHGMSAKTWEELIFRTRAIALWHLTAKEETPALVCIQNGIPYIGVCCNAAHIKLLVGKLQTEVFQNFLDKNSKLYKEDLAKLLKTGEPTPQGKAKPKAKGKAAPKPAGKRKNASKAKAKSKRGKKDPEANNNEEDAEGSESSEPEDDPVL